MRKLLNIVAIFFVFGLVAGCGKKVEGPSADDIQSALTVNLPVGLKVDSVDVVASENTGSAVEPAYRTRSNIVLKYTENFYDQVGTVDDKPLVKETGKKGDEVKAVLITNATPVGDKDWKVSVEKIDMPNITGTAASKFGTDGFIVKDSPEHKAALKAEQQKEADAKNQQEAELAAARNKFIGTWSSSLPVLFRDMVYTYNGHKMGMSVKISSIDGTVGTGTGKIYVYSNPQEAVSSPISVTMDDSGDFVTVSYDQSVTHDGLNFSTGGVWKLSSDGTFQDGRGGGNYVAQLKKN